MVGLHRAFQLEVRMRTDTHKKDNEERDSMTERKIREGDRYSSSQGNKKKRI